MTDLPEELIIDLDPPIVFGQTTINQLVLKEPTVGQMKKATDELARTNSDLGMAIALVSAVSGVQAKLVEQVPMRKFKEATDYLMGFTSGTPAITTPSESP